MALLFQLEGLSRVVDHPLDLNVLVGPGPAEGHRPGGLLLQQLLAGLHIPGKLAVGDIGAEDHKFIPVYPVDISRPKPRQQHLGHMADHPIPRLFAPRWLSSAS